MYLRDPQKIHGKEAARTGLQPCNCRDVVWATRCNEPEIPSPVAEKGGYRYPICRSPFGGADVLMCANLHPALPEHS